MTPSFKDRAIKAMPLWEIREALYAVLNGEEYKRRVFTFTISDYPKLFKEMSLKELSIINGEPVRHYDNNITFL